MLTISEVSPLLARHSVHFFGFSIFEYCKLTLGSPFAIFEPWIWRRLGPVPACLQSVSLRIHFKEHPKKPEGPAPIEKSNFYFTQQGSMRLNDAPMIFSNKLLFSRTVFKGTRFVF